MPKPVKEPEVVLSKKELKKIEKLSGKITYHLARNEKDKAAELEAEIKGIREAAASREMAAIG